MNNIEISVALCTYNGEKYLEKQLESYVAQTHLPDELVVVDDCSTDSTVDILKSFSEAAPFKVRLLFNEKNLGSTKNFEKAIDECDGRIIVLSDQDDVWQPEKLALIHERFAAEPETGVLFSNADLVDENLNPLANGDLWDSVKFSKKRRRKFNNGEFLVSRNVVTGATMSFRSSLRHLFMPIPKEWVHDGWIALILAFYTDIKYIDRKLIKYRQHSDNQIGARKKRLVECLREVGQGNRDELMLHLRQLRLVLDKVESEEVGRPGLVGDVRRKIRHVEARLELPSSRLHRALDVFKEYKNGNYSRYENGLNTSIRDLLS